MDDLPHPLLLEILNRLADSSDLARCRLASRTLNFLSYDVNSVTLHCSFDRYLRSRSPSPPANSPITPFKSAFNALISRLGNLETVSIGVEKPLRGIHYDEFEDESDDLYLTDVGFVSEWLPSVSPRLKSLSVSDFWIQSCWRRSDLLALLSRHCSILLNLEVKNAWLSVDGLYPIPTLTKLTLEFIRFDDENLTKLNESFPSLQVLNLIGVGGLREPKINLQHLTAFEWTVSNAPLTLSITAPNLTSLKLICVKPRMLMLDTPLLSDFHLSVEQVRDFNIKQLGGLKQLVLKSSNISSLICRIPSRKLVKSLSLDSSRKLVKSLSLDSSRKLEQVDADGAASKLTLSSLFEFFPNLNSLVLGPGIFSELETSFCTGCSQRKVGMTELKDIMAYLVISGTKEVSFSIISCLLENCSNLSSVALLIHQDLNSAVASNFISKSAASCSRIRWKWGMWKEGTKDTWVRK